MKKLIFSFIIMALALPSFVLATENNDDSCDANLPTPVVRHDTFNSEGDIVLAWDKIDHPDLDGYKVVISKDDSTPAYPANGYVAWITNRNINFYQINNTSAYRNGDFGSYLEEGEDYYFSVTAVYGCGEKITGNVLELTYPENSSNDGSAFDNLYTNESMEFSLLFPTSWENYIANQENNSVAFGLPGQSSIFLVSRLSIVEWNTLQAEEGPKPAEIKRNNQYVYAYTGAQAVIDSLWGESRLVDSIIDTFEFTHDDEDSNDGYDDDGNNTNDTAYPVPEVSIDSSEDGILLSWKKITDNEFTGYKVVVSKSTKNPKYPDHGYARYITNHNTISYLLNNKSDYIRGDFGGYLKPDEDYYFSITALYGNIRVAGNSIEATYNGPSHRTKPDTDPLINMAEKAQQLLGNNLGDILGELEQLRSMVREQANEIKYLRSLMSDMHNIAQSVQDALNQFITYGVDENTQKLGEGERAAVIHSFKSAFNKLPETDDEMADAIKIANGRWPSMTNDTAENRAKVEFKKIYLRDADMNNPNDNAAVTVMAYGLRQKAENRNLDSEREGIKTFKYIYGYTPDSTEDWNIMQAITYSGATR